MGVNDTSGTLARLIGLRAPASQFPPAALTRSGAVSSSELTFVVPVTFGGADWGLLAIGGNAETRTTSARDKYNHWAALLAVALDQERLVANLREQRRALEQAASRERAHPDDRDELSASIAVQLGGARSPLELEHRVRTATGEYRWMMCRAVTVLDDAGCPTRLVGALVDMTARKEQELALRRNALRDPETGLANRTLFVDRLGAAIKRTRRSEGSDCAVVLLRVAAGSPEVARGEEGPDADVDVEVRREVVRRLRRSLRAGDSAARLGQDEFAVLVDELLALRRVDLGVAVVAGVIASIQSFHDADDTLREAEIAMLRAAAQPEPRRRSALR